MSAKNSSSKKGGFWPFGSNSPVNPEDERSKCIEKCNAPKKGMMEGLMGSKTPTPQPTAVSSQDTLPAEQAPSIVPPPAAKKGWIWGGKRRSKGSKKTRKNKKRKGTRRRCRK